MIGGTQPSTKGRPSRVLCNWKYRLASERKRDTGYFHRWAKFPLFYFYGCVCSSRTCVRKRLMCVSSWCTLGVFYIRFMRFDAVYFPPALAVCFAGANLFRFPPEEDVRVQMAYGLCSKALCLVSLISITVIVCSMSKVHISLHLYV